MYCPKCGKEIADGEVCSCGYSQDGEKSSPLPDGKAIAESAKNAAEALKNSPFVSEVLATVAGAAADPEKQVKENSERTDILWVIMAVLESVLTSLGLAIFINSLMNSALKAVSFGSPKLGAGTFFKIFGAAFLWSVICIAVLMLMYMLFMKIHKKQISFSAAANTMATAAVPSAAMVFAGGLLSLIYAPLGTFLIIAALITLVSLCYSSVRNENGAKLPAFWLFVIFASVTAAVCTLAGNLCMKMFVESFAESLVNRLF
ncbi:MAG: hypothetical protein NC253_15585 [Ruminococcus sp.]|nr:hypothetical protein [Ruminococcus sp.]MCM1382836.1 hypothetical protein [Muribaculaceae bacterium]MCM1480991.1 hypothetical protein [Muribaculaceae bacterium]